MRRRAACTAAVVLASVLSASAQSKTAAPATVDPCALLTKDDAAAALGEPVAGPPQSKSMPGQAAMCEYTGSGLHRIHLNLIFLDASSAAIYKAMCAQKKKDGLTGLGETSCWYNDKHEELQALKGQQFFSIELRRGGDPTEAIKAAARKVYERLK